MGLFDLLPAPGTRNNNNKRTKVSVPVKDEKKTKTIPKTREEEVVARTVEEKLDKITKHMKTRFEICLKMFMELITRHRNVIERKHRKKVMLCFRAAVEAYYFIYEGEKLVAKKTEENSKRFKEIYEALESLIEDGQIQGSDKKTIVEMEVWRIYCVLQNEIVFADDSYAFSFALKNLLKLFQEAKPVRRRKRTTTTNENENDEENEEREKIEKEIEQNADIPKEERAEALKFAMKCFETEKANELEIEYFEEKRRDALIDCLTAIDDAATKKLWSRSIIDQFFVNLEQLVNSEDYYEAVFAEEQLNRLKTLIVKVKQSRAKSGNGNKAGVDWVSDFDKYASTLGKSSSISIRGGVGGENTKDGRGDGKFGDR